MTSFMNAYPFCGFPLASFTSISSQICKADTPSYCCFTSTWWQNLNGSDQEALCLPAGHRDSSDLDTSSVWKLRGNGSPHMWGELKDGSSYEAWAYWTSWTYWTRLQKSWNHGAEKALQTPGISGAAVEPHSWSPAGHTELRPAARIHDLSIALPHAVQKQKCQIAIALSDSLTDLPMQTIPTIWSRKNTANRPYILFMQTRTVTQSLKIKKTVSQNCWSQLAWAGSNYLPWQSYFNKIKLLPVKTAFSISVLTNKEVSSSFPLSSLAWVPTHAASTNSLALAAGARQRLLNYLENAIPLATNCFAVCPRCRRSSLSS